MDANEEGRDEKGTSGSHRASATSWKVYFCDMTLNLNRTRCISLDLSSPKGTFSQDTYVQSMLQNGYSATSRRSSVNFRVWYQITLCKR